jgi:hypothetical protein
MNPMKLPAVTFGTIYRLVSKDGETNKRYEQARKALVESYMDQVCHESPNPKPDLLSANITTMDQFFDEIGHRVGSFQPPSDKFAYLAVNTRRKPDPIAEQFLITSRGLYDEAKMKFPGPDNAENTALRKNWYVAELDQMAEGCKQYAVEKVI